MNREIYSKTMGVIPVLEELKHLHSPRDIKDKIYYLSYLKEVGILGKKIYGLQPEPWLKDWLIKLHNYIKLYVKQNI